MPTAFPQPPTTLHAQNGKSQHRSQLRATPPEPLASGIRPFGVNASPDETCKVIIGLTPDTHHQVRVFARARLAHGGGFPDPASSKRDSSEYDGLQHMPKGSREWVSLWGGLAPHGDSRR